MGQVPRPYAFENDIVVLPLKDMLPLREVSARTRKTPNYKRIAASIEEIGLVEPLVVYGRPEKDGKYLLLDGHLRRRALLDNGQAEARCILATDDEAFTYNKRVNRIATVQEALTMVHALERGVSEKKLAKALNVNVQQIKRRVGLLNGICPEAITLMKNETVNPVTFDALRKMTPGRQVEACKLMASASNFTSIYAKALLAGSKETDLKAPTRSLRRSTVTAAGLARMEREMSALQQDFKTTEVSYGEDMVGLVVATRYVSRLIGNDKIARYLNDNHPEMLREFRTIISAASLI